MKGNLKLILQDDWYKTASPEEMRTALFHFEVEVMDRLFNGLTHHKSKLRNNAFDQCSKDNN